MDLVFYAALMGFIMASPFGVIGATSALAAIQHRLVDAMKLVAGVMIADLIVITTVNFAITFLPNLSWVEVKSWVWLWWPMILGLLGYGVWVLYNSVNMPNSTGILYPKRPFLHGLGWTLLANPKNWLGTFAAYAGWQVAGLLDSPQMQILVASSAWFGGLIAWFLWVALCWQAKAWQYQAEQIAHKVIGVLCIVAALTACVTLVSA